MMQNSHKQYAERPRRDHSVADGDQVLIETHNLNLSHLPSKLRPRFCGPFLVEAQVTPVTFRLRLPDTWKLHNAFHVQLLKPYKDPNQQFQGRQLPPPPPVLVQDEPEYEVERVLTHRRRGGKTLEFLLRWKGYDPTEDSWVAEADMGNARRALKDYLVKQEGAGVDAVGARGATGTGAAAGGTGAVPAGSGGATRPRPYFVPLLEQLQPACPLPVPSPYTGPTGGLAEHREPASRPASPVRATRNSRRAPRPRPPAVPGTHQMALRPSTAPLRVPLPSPPESSLPVPPDPASDSLRATSPTVTRLLATVVTDPSFDSTAASALVAELVDFAACCRLDYATSLVAASESVCPPSVGGKCALSTDVLEDRQEEFQCFAVALPHLVSTLLAPEGDPDAPNIPTPHSYAEAIEGPYSSQWQAAMDAEMASWKSTGTYVDEVPPPGANIVSGMWIFR
ncbi:unnamed protein product, partial [Closterium sp. NIES-53]